MMIARALALLAVMLLPNTAFAQAFGFTMGMPLEELTVIEQVPSTMNYRYAVVPPTPNPRLENYSAVVTPQDGLCQVIGATPNETEFRAKQLWDILYVALRSVYGDGTRTSEREVIFGKTTPPVMAAALRIGRNGTTVMVEYIFANYASCAINGMKLDQTGL